MPEEKCNHVPAIVHRSGGPSAELFNTCGVCGSDIIRIVSTDPWITADKALDMQMDYILEHAERIYVREKVGDEWGSYALSKLPAKQALGHAFRWIREGTIPIRMKTPEEMNAEG